MSDPANPNNASYKLILPKDPRDGDLLGIQIQYRDVNIRASYRDGRRQDLRDLIAEADWFIDKAHLEYSVRLEALDIDGDLGKLFPEDLEDNDE